jgi:hypothetical protein
MTPVESQNGKDVFDAAQAVAIRAELDRLLASSTFRAGKRYQSFLQFFVNEALAPRRSSRIPVVRRNSVPNRISDLALAVVTRYET